MASKIRGKLLANFHDLKIYAVLDRPKRSGKYRVWVTVRQSPPKRWRVFATMGYTQGHDLGYERVLSRQDATRIRKARREK